METLTVNLGKRSYPIYIGKTLLSDPQLLQRHVRSQQVLIVCGEQIADWYLAPLKHAFENYQCDILLLPDGEQYKTWDTLNRIFDFMLKCHHHRTTTVIALGGGVIGDMAGFAAACYQRGVNYIQIPTTLLAHVDASVGGKVGINHPKGKNMIGAFHQPSAVIIDTITLETLSDRDLSSGLSEMIKAALIRDPEFFYWLETHYAKLLARDHQAFEYAIKRACEIKIGVVVADERESDLRSILNFGHTFSHALEYCLGYGSWRHGEAVAVGMVLAARLSVMLGWLEPSDAERIERILFTVHLPICLPPGVEYKRLLQAIALDKKIFDGKLRFILLKGLGNAVITTEVNESLLKELLEAQAVC